MVDCYMCPIRLALLSSKMQISPDKLHSLCIVDRNLLIVVMLIGGLMWIYYYQTAVDQFWLTDRLTPSVTDWLLIMYGFLLQQLFFVVTVVYSGSWDFLYGWCKQLFVSELNNAYFSRHLFLNSAWVAKVLHNSFLHLLLKNCDFFEHRYFTR